MDKISFILPTSNFNENKVNENKVNENKVNENKVNENKVNENKVNENKVNENNTYTKITTNVYRFNLVSNIIDKSTLYNDALKYRQIGDLYKSIELFKMYETEFYSSDTYKTYELYINLALLTAETNGSFDNVSNYYGKATQLCPDRAEPYYYFAIYCNKNHKYDKAYELLQTALEMTYEDVKDKYENVQISAYGKHLYDELSVTCYWLQKYEESKRYLLKIINDDDFIDLKPRLSANLEQIEKETNK
jgi:tetratricopeptide (TPR) repeat protein